MGEELWVELESPFVEEPSEEVPFVEEEEDFVEELSEEDCCVEEDEEEEVSRLPNPMLKEQDDNAMLINNKKMPLRFPIAVNLR